MRRGTRGRVQLAINFQALAEGVAAVVEVAEAFVEGQDLRVGGADHDVDFWAPHGAEEFFGMIHEEFAESFSLVVGVDAEVVDFGAMAVVADHGGGDDPALKFTDD